MLGRKIITRIREILTKIETSEKFASAKKEVKECCEFFKKGNYEKAIEIGEEIVKKHPDNVLAHLYLTMSYFMVAKFEQSLEHFKVVEKLISNEIDRVSILEVKASLYIHKNDLDKALNLLEEALKLATNAKDRAGIYENMAYIYHLKGDQKKENECIREAFKLHLSHEWNKVNCEA
jgi:tetratricopeptide (TPR) repeat protein